MTACTPPEVPTEFIFRSARAINLPMEHIEDAAIVDKIKQFLSTLQGGAARTEVDSFVLVKFDNGTAFIYDSIEMCSKFFWGLDSKLYGELLELLGKAI